MTAYYQTNEPPHCPTCECSCDTMEMEIMRNGYEAYKAMRDDCAWTLTTNDNGATLSIHFPNVSAQDLMANTNDFQVLLNSLKNAKK